MVMLIFFEVLSFNYTFIPIFFTALALLFYITIHQRLYSPTATFLFIINILLFSFINDKTMIINNLYQYNSHLTTIFDVPIAAILICSSSIFQALYFNNGIFYALDIDTPIYKKREFLKLFSLMFMDGFHVLTIGFFIEHLFVKYNLGSWIITNQSEFDIFTFNTLSSYFIIGFGGNSIFRLYHFFKNETKVAPFKGYLNIFATIYLICFLISIYVLFDVNFSPIFAIISLIICLTLIINARIHKQF